MLPLTLFRAILILHTSGFNTTASEFTTALEDFKNNNEIYASSDETN